MNWKLSHENLISQNIEIPGKEVVFLGPDLMLSNCTINNNATGRDLTICGVKMSGGTFKTKKRLTNFQFRDIEFDGVTFEGTFAGCDFGVEKKLGKCDFSNSILNGCRFIGEIAEKIQLPNNDHLVLSVEAIKEIDIESELTPALKMFLSVLSENQPDHLKIVVSHIPSLAKQLRLDESKVVEFGAKYA